MRDRLARNGASFDERSAENRERDRRRLLELIESQEGNRAELEADGEAFAAEALA